MDLYIAMDKETGAVLSGAKGQYAFRDVGTLRRSMVHSLKIRSLKEGKKASDFYDACKFNIVDLEHYGLLEEVD